MRTFYLAESRDGILDHLQHFDDIYAWSEIVEIVDGDEAQSLRREYTER